ncbi:MAG: O-antigen ligase family protein [Deltaproteobacteria bacterium]|nr:O-antigen ligase family protein [Deltaproteobacteria bacterium]
MAKKNRIKPTFDAPSAPSTPIRPAPPVQTAAAPTIQNQSIVDDLPAIVLGLTAMLLPRLVEVGIRDLYQLPKTFAMTVCAAWMLAAVAAMGFLKRPLGLQNTPLKWPIVGLAASVALGVAFAPDETGGVLSIFAKMDAYRWAAALLIGLLTISTVRTPRQLLYVVGGMLLGGVQVAIFGIAQHHNIDGLLPEDARRWVGINAPGSTFGNRNMAAQLIVSVMPGAYVLLAMSLRWWRENRVQRALLIGSAGNILLFLLLYYLRLSVTRSAWGGAALGLMIAVGLYAIGVLRHRSVDKSDGAEEAELGDGGGRKVAPLVLGLGASGVVAIALASALLVDAGFSARFDEGVGDRKRKMSMVDLVSTVGDTEDSHWAMRRMMWASTWEAIKAKPLGGGAGNWRVLFPQYVTQREDNDHFSIAKQPTRAHNDFLQLWSEYGIQGFASFMALILVSMWLSMRTLALSRRPRLRQRDDVAWMALGSLSSVAGLIAICGDALLSFPFQLPAPTFFFLVHIGVIGAAYAFVRRRHEDAYPEVFEADDDGTAASARMPQPQPLQGGALLALLVAAVLSVGFVHWENDRLLEAEKGFTFARSKQKRGQAGAALIEIERAVALNGDDFQNHFIEGLCHNSLGNMPKAIDAIERSLRLYPNLLNAWVNLALFAQKAGDEVKMQKALDAALALKPDEAYALNTRARWLNRARRFDETIAALEPFLERHRQNKQFLDNLESAYEAKGRWADVAKVRAFGVRNVQAAKIDDRQPGARQRRARDGERVHKARLAGWKSVGEAWTRAGNHAEAAKAYGQAAALAGSGDGSLKRAYALALAQAGDWKKAWHETGVTMDVDPSQEGPLLQTLGKLKLSAQDDASKQKIENLIQRVHRMAKAKKAGK